MNYMKNIAKPILLVSGIVVTLLFTGTVLGYASNNEDGNGTLENPIAVVLQQPGFCSIFRSWGFIGDSLCSGEHEYHKSDGSKGYADLYEYSWGQFICYATGAKGDNYSQGGETARGCKKQAQWTIPSSFALPLPKAHPCNTLFPIPAAQWPSISAKRARMFSLFTMI